MDKKFNILYVDDERGNLNAFKNTFRRDYRILIAETPAEGLDILEKEEIDLILSDQRMPEMTGVEFLRRTKKKHPNPNRILVTAYSDFEAIQNAINEANIFKFVKKPWDSNTFKATIDHALEAYDLKRKNRELTTQLSTKNKKLEQANKELSESDKLKDDFLQIISHEMRTPLNGLKGATQLFKIEIDDGEHTPKAVPLYNILEVSTTRLEQFLLLVERITNLKARRYSLKSETVNIATLVESAQSALSNKSQSNPPNFTVSNCDNCTIEADSETLSICIREIMHNAIKNSPEGSQVEVKTIRDDSSLSIEVTDHGSGFSETVLNNLFKVFIRDGNQSDKSLGLNLALVKLVMDLHNGKVDVQNNDGGGATVRLTLNTTPSPTLRPTSHL